MNRRVAAVDPFTMSITIFELKGATPQLIFEAYHFERTTILMLMSLFKSLSV